MARLYMFCTYSYFRFDNWISYFTTKVISWFEIIAVLLVDYSPISYLLAIASCTSTVEQKTRLQQYARLLFEKLSLNSLNNCPYMYFQFCLLSRIQFLLQSKENRGPSSSWMWRDEWQWGTNNAFYYFAS